MMEWLVANSIYFTKYCISSWDIVLTKSETRFDLLQFEMITLITQTFTSIPRFLTYLKLFFGMGFMWTMEIVAGLSDESVDEAYW